MGCPLVDPLSWKTDAPADAYIVGLKELPENDDSPLRHKHIFFAHCFKNQGGWRELLQRFDKGKGTILDLEFLNDDNGKRVAAFGYMAGFAGAAVGIDVWCHQKIHGSKTSYGVIKPYPNEDALIKYTKERLAAAGKKRERREREREKEMGHFWLISYFKLRQMVARCPRFWLWVHWVVVELVLATLHVKLVFLKRISSNGISMKPRKVVLFLKSWMQASIKHAPLFIIAYS